MKSHYIRSTFCLFLSTFLLVSCSTTSSKPEDNIRATFPEPDRARHEAVSNRYMISTQGYWTSLAAKEMFEAGGNIIDAAAAASFAISVERPQSTGIGGGGFMLIRLKDQKNVMAVDFRETAPAKSTEKMFQDAKGEVVPDLSTEGILASATPGVVAGVLEIHQKYGKLSRAKILAPAIRLAENGFEVYPHLATAINANKELLKTFPASAQLFLKSDGTPLQEGDTLKQPELANTLRAISLKGKDGFYKGWVADALIAEHKRLGGNLTQTDLNQYRVKFRKPVVDNFKEYRIFSMPPPSSGGIHVIQILNILEGFNLKNPYAPDTVHYTAAAMQLAYADRSKYLGDSDFVKVPMIGLTSQPYADQLRATIPMDSARKFTQVAPGQPLKYESSETTHFTIADDKGNVVSSTQTVNGWLGSGVVVPKAGFILNNEMDDFSAKPGVPNKFGVIGGKENAIQPKKRPLSSMSPTLVEKNGAPILALGSPAGSQIITCVVHTILNYLEYKMPLYDAVTALRYHHQWTPDEILVESPGFSKHTSDKLSQMGYQLKQGGIGCKIQAVAFQDGKLRGVTDPRGEGLSVGENPHPNAPVFKKSSAPVHGD